TVRVRSSQERDDAVRRGAEILRNGGIVAFPTETVYGVGACVANPGAIARLRELKQRPKEKAFTVHVASRDDASELAPNMPKLARRFARKCWPGPLTIIAPVGDGASTALAARLSADAATAVYYNGTVGLRCPDDATAEALLRAVDAPVVAASANRADGPAPRTARDVRRALGNEIDLLIDGGKTRYAKASTIIRFGSDSYEVLREGVIDLAAIGRLAMLRILFVCTGNTCRSPMAEGLARRLLADRLGCREDELADRGIAVESAGTAGGFGAASDQSVAVMGRRSIEISQHSASALSPDRIREADYIFTMTASHRDIVCDMVPSARERVALLLEDQDVRDPIGGDEAEYEACVQAIEKGVRARLQEVSL
ncbi:MAG: threonylcarbamoyl-AMP synthase, partial [Planctomycetes bacterium]|nr:threonylcarbamoyl-AMP synthase [Planctomycetota bacterium]